MHITKKQYDEHHHHTIHNKTDILKSETCACFYCFKTFSPEDIDEWIDDCDEDSIPTAVCPLCGIDTVIGDASGLPITDASFLEHMHFYGFDHTWSNGGILSVRTDNMATRCVTCTFIGHLEHIDEIYPQEKLKIKRLEMKNLGCPWEWEGETSDGMFVYIRERSNVLRIDVDDEAILLLRTNDDFYGYESLVNTTKGLVEFSD